MFSFSACHFSNKVSWSHFIIYESHDVEVPLVDHDYVKDFAAPELYATSTLFQATIIKFPE
jgi:hypothetical protein